MFALIFSLPLLLLQTPPPAGEQPTTQPTYDVGPLRIDPVAMMEVRRWSDDPAMAARMQQGLQMQLRLHGERIADLARFGTLVFTELKDDTGESLIADDTYTAIDKFVLRQSPYPPERLRENGLPIMTRVKPSGRAARTISGRGTVRVILAKESEKITIEHPFQFYGKPVEHPRLKELGIQMVSIPVDQVENVPPGERALVFDYPKGGELVQNVVFYDGWMRPLLSRDTWMNRVGGGTPVQFFRFEGPNVNDEMQMVIEVHPKVDDVQVPLELKGFALP